MTAPESLSLPRGTVHTLRLPGGGATGHQWFAFQQGDACIRVDKHYADDGDAGTQPMPGACRDEIVVVTAVAVGRARLVLKKLRRWEPQDRSAEVRVFDVVVT